MSLSLSTTSRLAFIAPALLSASNAMPAVIAPSPMMATARRSEAHLLRGYRHAEGSGDRGAGVTCTKSVIFTFRTSRKAGDTTALAQAGHRFASSGQYLVRVSLMADIPYQAVVRRIEHIMQGDAEFDYTQVGSQVSTGLGHAADQQTGVIHRPAQAVLCGSARAVGWGH